MRKLMMLLVMVPATLFAQNIAAVRPAAEAGIAAPPPAEKIEITLNATAAPLPLPPGPPSTVSGALMVAARPQAPAAHQFLDRTNLIGFAVHAGTRAADAAQTCVLLGKSGRQEAWLPFKSCGAIATYSMAMVPAQIGTSYLLHKRGMHRLERFTPYLWAAPSAAGFAISLKAW